MATMLLSLSTILIITSCCTKPDIAKLSGRVVLENDSGDPANDPADYAGITLALYSPAELDTAIVRANTTYPHIGVIIDQETEFDHRHSSPLYSVTTEPDGSFNINNIQAGKYNLVASSPGWGSRYAYNCDIWVGENQLEDILATGRDEPDMKLYPEYSVSDFDTLSVLREDHTYLVPSSATITHDVRIENGAKLMLGLNSNLTITGSFYTVQTGSEKYARISVAGEELVEQQWFGRILVQGDADLEGIVFSRSMNGLQFQFGSVSLSQIRGMDGPASIIMRENSSASISNLCISDIGILNTSGGYQGIIETTEGGIDLTSCSNMVLEKSVIVRCISGIRVREYNEGEVSNCYLVNNSIGMEVANNYCLIQNNYFAGNYCLDIRLYGTTSPVVTKNNFNSIRGVNVGYNVVQQYVNCTPVITYNNLNCQDIAIRIIGYNNRDVTANDNYYYTTDLARIEELIIDQNDYNPQDISNMVHVGTGYILFQPYRTSRVPDAGIQGGA